MKLYISISYIAVCFFASRPSSATGTEVSVGNDCKVLQVPTGTHTFDFNPLHKTRTDYSIITVNGNEQVFQVNVCGPLTKLCNGQRNVSVCLKQTSGTEIAIGYMNNSVVYDNGRLQFELHGDQCANGKNSTVTIIMMCDDTATEDTGPELLPASQSNCTFYFIWYNRYACTPHKEVKCSTMDANGRLYDLSRLTLHSSNYVAFMKDNKQGPYVKFELNVCHSVVLGHEIICQYNSGVCATGIFSSFNGRNSSSRNLGDVSSGPYFENDILKLSYKGGDICLENGEADLHISTVIEFTCDPNKHDTHPKVNVKLTSPCHYHFIWETSAACPIELKIGSDAISLDKEANDCIFVNPVTKSQLDLRSLMGKEVHINISSSLTLKLSICSPLQNSSCGPDSSSCLVETSTSAGNSSSKSLAHHTGSPVPYLYYTGGSPCKNGTLWRTTIMFDCGSEDSNPDIITVLDCHYVIRWYTHLVCERKIQCTATNKDRVIDLTSLISTTDNYKISIGTTEVVVNICQPILSSAALGCPTGSAACMVDGMRKNMSLGYPFDSPKVNDKGDTVLTYLNGSPCPSSPTEKLTSTINFVCDIEIGKGRPTFKQVIDDCRYEFEWRTSYVCETEDEEFNVTSDNCLIHDKKSQLVIDLKPLRKPGGYKAVGFHSNSNKNYAINLCGLNNTCDGAGVCEELKDSWASYGQIVNVEHSFTDRQTKLFYSKGAPCDASGKLRSSAEIWLQCEEGAGIGEPRVLLESKECYVLFEWKTEVVCRNVKGTANNGSTETQNKSSVPVGLRLGVIAFVVGFCLLLGLYHFKLLPKCPKFNTGFNSLIRSRRDQVAYSRQQREDTEDWSSY